MAGSATIGSTYSLIVITELAGAPATGTYTLKGRDVFAAGFDVNAIIVDTMDASGAGTLAILHQDNTGVNTTMLVAATTSAPSTAGIEVLALSHDPVMRQVNADEGIVIIAAGAATANRIEFIVSQHVGRGVAVTTT